MTIPECLYTLLTLLLKIFTAFYFFYYDNLQVLKSVSELVFTLFYFAKLNMKVKRYNDADLSIAQSYA